MRKECEFFFFFSLTKKEKRIEKSKNKIDFVYIPVQRGMLAHPKQRILPTCLPRLANKRAQDRPIRSLRPGVQLSLTTR